MKTTHNTSVGPRPRWLVLVRRIHCGRGERVVSTPTCSRQTATFLLNTKPRIFSCRVQSYRVVTTGLETGVHHSGSVTSNCPRFAPGGPGIEPRWARGAKITVGTAYSTSSQIWYTLGHGCVTEEQTEDL